MSKKLIKMLIFLVVAFFTVTFSFSACTTAATTETTAAATTAAATTAAATTAAATTAAATTAAPAAVEAQGTKGLEDIGATIAAMSPNSVIISGDEKINVPDTGEPFKIAASIWSMDNPYFVVMTDMMRAVIEAYGGELVIADTFRDPQKQMDQIEQFIAEGYDGVMVTAADSFGIVPGIKALKAAGIPVAACDNAIYNELPDATFVANNYEAGYLSAQRMVERLGGKGNIVVLDWPMAESARSRITALYNIITQNPNVVIIEQQKGAEVPVGQDTMETWLTKYGDQINAIFAVNEPGTIGALQAVEAAGLKDKIFGATVDGMREGCQKMKDGMDIECIGEQFPEKQGRLAAEALISLIRGQALPAEWQGKICLMKSNLITKADTLAGKYDYKWEPITYTKQ